MKSIGRDTYSFDVGLSEIFMQFPEVDEGKGDADHVDSDPQRVQYVMTKRAVYEWAARSIVSRFRVRS